MNNQGTPAFVPFPMIPFGNQITSHQEAPARVRMAAEFIRDMTFKGMSRIAVNDLSIEEIEGKELTIREEEARTAACNLLTSYFKGELNRDTWEKDEGQGRPMGGVPGELITCFACPANRPRQECRFCKGTGVVIVYAATGG